MSAQPLSCISQFPDIEAVDQRHGKILVLQETFKAGWTHSFADSHVTWPFRLTSTNQWELVGRNSNLSVPRIYDTLNQNERNNLLLPLSFPPKIQTPNSPNSNNSLNKNEPQRFLARSPQYIKMKTLSSRKPHSPPSQTPRLSS